MDLFPRTSIGGISVSRMIVGTNWFIGSSHASLAKDMYIREHVSDRNKIADILEIYLKAGVDGIMGPIAYDLLSDSIKEAENRVGRRMVVISTPFLPFSNDPNEVGFDLDGVEKILDNEAACGAHICMPHQSVTDTMLDRYSRKIRGMDTVCKMIRDRNMVPGLSTHMPETIIYADETGLDVETYIQIYNAMGFLMQIEVDWIADIIQNARKPVLTIKPMAAGQIRPFQALYFAWNSLRACDMITLGTMSPREAEECIQMSLDILGHKKISVPLQETRSKSSVKPKTEFKAK